MKALIALGLLATSVNAATIGPGTITAPLVISSDTVIVPGTVIGEPGRQTPALILLGGNVDVYGGQFVGGIEMSGTIHSPILRIYGSLFDVQPLPFGDVTATGKYQDGTPFSHAIHSDHMAISAVAVGGVITFIVPAPTTLAVGLCASCLLLFARKALPTHF